MPKTLLLQHKITKALELSEIIRNKIYIGDAQAAKNESILKKNRITHVLNCTPNLPNYYSDSLVYMRINVTDGTPMIHKHFQCAIDFIKEGDRVFVHCQQGKSRSVTFVMAYLMQEHQLSFDAALELIKSKRSCAKPHMSFAAELIGWNEALAETKFSCRR